MSQIKLWVIESVHFALKGVNTIPYSTDSFTSGAYELNNYELKLECSQVEEQVSEPAPELLSQLAQMYIM